LSFETLLVEKQANLGIITLNRPERLNALNRTLTTEFDRSITQLEQDGEVKVIIVTGAGERAFSAGADIHELSQQSEQQLKERGTHFADWTWHLASCKKPTIGAVNGLAYGGGALMASIFDMRIGCERTTFRFLGVMYGRINSTWTLPLIVGWPMAKELLLTGRLVEAQEALRLGLLNRLVPAAELMKSAIEMGQAIAEHDAGVVRVIKEILNTDIGLKWREMLVNEGKTASQSLKQLPPSESFKDFLERKPK
jgi:enoyl-CoA hydratase/carnithine racemase